MGAVWHEGDSVTQMFLSPSSQPGPQLHLRVLELRTGTGWDPRPDRGHVASSPVPSPGPAEPGEAVWMDSSPATFPHHLQ